MKKTSISLQTWIDLEAQHMYTHVFGYDINQLTREKTQISHYRIQNSEYRSLDMEYMDVRWKIFSPNNHFCTRRSWMSPPLRYVLLAQPRVPRNTASHFPFGLCLSDNYFFYSCICSCISRLSKVVNVRANNQRTISQSAIMSRGDCKKKKRKETKGCNDKHNKATTW